MALQGVQVADHLLMVTWIGGTVAFDEWILRAPQKLGGMDTKKSAVVLFNENVGYPKITD